MLSAARPPFPSRPNSPSLLLREVRAICRRVCILRALGKFEEAEILSTGQLTSAIALARESQELSEEQLEALFTAEEDRVDTAQALAEILLPLLTAANAAAATENHFSPNRYFASDSRAEADRTPDSSTELAASASSNTSPMLPGIADFIDEMLTQDRAPEDARNSRRPA
jgi:hypothetical protein